MTQPCNDDSVKLQVGPFYRRRLRCYEFEEVVPWLSIIDNSKDEESINTADDPENGEA